MAGYWNQQRSLIQRCLLGEGGLVLHLVEWLALCFFRDSHLWSGSLSNQSLNQALVLPKTNQNPLRVYTMGWVCDMFRGVFWVCFMYQYVYCKCGLVLLFPLVILSIRTEQKFSSYKGYKYTKNTNTVRELSTMSWNSSYYESVTSIQ